MLPAMKFAASVLMLTWAALVPPCMADPAEVSPQDATIAKQFADAIEAGNAQDPDSPNALNTRLAFAEFLTGSKGGDCRARLDDAQNQLDLARSSPAAVGLPFALAREAAIDYRIHLGRASCGGGEAARDQELRAALGAAHHAVDRYRDEFDAVSMTTMQFNVAVTYQELGERAAAIEALETAIKMDREYGFREDANDNYRTLSQWRNQPAGPEEVAALMGDFPKRSTALSFGWSDNKTDLTVTLEYEQLSAGETLNVHVAKAAERGVRRRSDGWSVSFEPRGTRYEIDDWPNDESLVHGMVISLTHMALLFHDFDVTGSGNFVESNSARKFERNLRSDVKAVTKFLAQNATPSRLTRQIRNESADYGDSTEALAAEAYNIETGTWIGASLEQGVWYDMSVPLSLPLAPELFVTHQIEFAFTRQVPCTADSTDEACVEIVLRATPDPEELRGVLTNLARQIGLPQKGTLQASSATYLRLVTDPRTLQFYESDLRRYSHWTVKGTKIDYPVTEYERTHAVSGPLARAR
jgi:tetratricopeptide (TPR) repeat protein